LGLGLYCRVHMHLYIIDIITNDLSFIPFAIYWPLARPYLLRIIPKFRISDMISD